MARPTTASVRSRASAIVYTALVLTLAAKLGLGVPGLAQAEANVSEWYPLDLNQGNLRIPTIVGGIPGFSLIDSSANIHSINQQFLKTHGLQFRAIGRTRVQGLQDIKTQRRLSKVPVELFGMSLTLRSITELDLGAADIQLKLGGSFMKNFVLQVDYPNARMRLLSHDAVDLDKLKNLRSKREHYTGSPMVKVELNGDEAVWLTLDTSNGYGNQRGILLDRSIAARAGWLSEFPVRETEYKDVNGQLMSFLDFELPKVMVGPYELGNVNVSVPQVGEDLERFKRHVVTGSNIKTTRRQSDGYIGYEVLKHFIVTIDYRGGDVHISIPKPAQAAEPITG